MHTFSHSADGVTKGLASTSGVSWTISLDDTNRVTGLVLPDRTLAYGYGTHGKVATVTETVSGTTTSRSYTYDAQGRLTGISGGGYAATVTYAIGYVRIVDDGDVFEYHLDADDRVISVERGADAAFRATRDTAGDIVTLSQGERVVQFTRDAFGRIVDTIYPGGRGARYSYDDLGNRRRSKYGSGGTVTYVHDAAGNIKDVTVTEPDGSVRRQRVTVGPANRIDRIVYEGAATLNVAYDKMSRPIKFHMGEVVVGVEYGRLGTIAKMTASKGDEWEPGDYRLAASTLNDARLEVVSRDPEPADQPHYDVVAFDRHLRAVPGDPIEAGVGQLPSARALLAVAGPLLVDGGPNWFEKPSNPVFQPAEYVSTNCCMPWDGEFCGPSEYGGGGVMPHRIRVQAQIGHSLISSSTVVAGDPIRMYQCLEALSDVRNGLVTRRDRKELEGPLEKVERRMRGCGGSGGCTPVHTQSFQGRNGYHADFEVHRGVACLP